MKNSKSDNITRYRIGLIVTFLSDGKEATLSECAEIACQATSNHRRLLDRLCKCGLLERPSHGYYRLYVRRGNECVGYYSFDWMRTLPDHLLGDYRGDLSALHWGYIGCPESEIKPFDYYQFNAPSLMPEKIIVPKNEKRKGWLLSWLGF